MRGRGKSEGSGEGGMGSVGDGQERKYRGRKKRGSGGEGEGEGATLRTDIRFLADRLRSWGLVWMHPLLDHDSLQGVGRVRQVHAAWVERRGQEDTNQGAPAQACLQARDRWATRDNTEKRQ